MTFTQNFISMAYNVTAVVQSDPTSGSGPAYLLNGLSDKGYWYQVGLSWNWNPGNSPGTGFNFVYEVFDPLGNSIYPTAGGAGLQFFSGPVNAGDTVLLNLYFSSAYGVAMFAKDYNTGATSSQTYGAQGASQFVGSPLSTANSQGFFTGLMTEWYHSSAFYGNVAPVVYSNPRYSLSSAWMWIDEFSCPNISCSNRTRLFFDYTPSPVQYAVPSQLHGFSSHGATEFSSAFELITGPAYLELTASYAVDGGGSGYSPPTFTYTYQGSTSAAALTTSPTTYTVDADTAWYVSGSLSGSTQTERWTLASGAASGVAVSSQTIQFAYQHQFLLRVSGGSAGGGTATWYASGTTSRANSTGVFNRGSGSGARVVSYSVDASSTPVAPTIGDVSVSVVMNSAHSVVFGSVAQFEVTQDATAGKALASITPPAIAGDAGWYDRGTVVDAVYAHSWNVVANKSRDVATGYSVDGGSAIPVQESGNGTFKVQLTVTAPTVVSVRSATQYYTAFRFTDASGNRSLIPTSLSLDAGGSTKDVPGFALWLDSGTPFTVSKLVFEGVDVKAPAQGTFNATGPEIITLRALVYDARLKVADVLGLPVAGAQVALTLANGTVISGTTGSGGEFAVTRVPLGTFTATASNLGSTARVEGDASVHALTTTSVLFSTVSLSLTLVLVAAAVGAAVFLLRRRKRPTPG